MPSATDKSTEKKVGKVAQIPRAEGGLEFVTRDFNEVGPVDVRLKIKNCGICHSDSFAFSGHWPGLQFPIVPGHEIIGVVDAVGSNVSRLKVGDRVGVGWHAGHCHECPSCRAGDYVTCAKLEIPGITRDGGYAEYAVFPEEACARVPEQLTSAEAAPLVCAGVTTYNALRHAGAMTGDTVAILGIGGLGHLGVQFANKMGFQTVAIARGKDKEEFAKELGAHIYIDSEGKEPVEVLKKIGGAKVILSTVTNSDAMTPWIDGLAVNGKLVLVGADVKPMAVNPVMLLGARRSIVGWPSGTSNDSEECMKFCALTGIRPMVETYSLDKASEGFERMMSGKARFRVVLEVSPHQQAKDFKTA